MSKELKISAEWIREPEYAGLTILDADGWDRNNYEFSYYVEKITKEEFENRLIRSTIMNYYAKVPFNEPIRISPYYSNIRIPRKLKKKVKRFCGLHWEGLNNGERLWYYLEHHNINYKNFLIKALIKRRRL